MTRTAVAGGGLRLSRLDGGSWTFNGRFAGSGYFRRRPVPARVPAHPARRRDVHPHDPRLRRRELRRPRHHRSVPGLRPRGRHDPERPPRAGGRTGGHGRAGRHRDHRRQRRRAAQDRDHHRGGGPHVEPRAHVGQLADRRLPRRHAGAHHRVRRPVHDLGDQRRRTHAQPRQHGVRAERPPERGGHRDLGCRAPHGDRLRRLADGRAAHRRRRHHRVQPCGRPTAVQDREGRGRRRGRPDPLRPDAHRRTRLAPCDLRGHIAGRRLVLGQPRRHARHGVRPEAVRSVHPHPRRRERGRRVGVRTREPVRPRRQRRHRRLRALRRRRTGRAADRRLHGLRRRWATTSSSAARRATTSPAAPATTRSAASAASTTSTATRASTSTCSPGHCRSRR